MLRNRKSKIDLNKLSDEMLWQLAMEIDVAGGLNKYGKKVLDSSGEREDKNFAFYGNERDVLESAILEDYEHEMTGFYLDMIDRENFYYFR